MGEPSATFGDPDLAESMDVGEGAGTVANTRDRGDELSDTEMAPDDDLEREGVRVLDETSDLEEDKEEASTGSHSNTLKLKEVSPETEKFESQFPFRNSNWERGGGKKSAIGEIELPQPPIARLNEPMTGSTNTKSCFPPQYFTIRAIKQRLLAPAVLGGVGSWGRLSQGASPGTQDCGFDVRDDERQYAAKNFHRMDVSRNISTSVSTDHGCLACTDPHSVGGEILSGTPKVFVLSDQAFPPILPTVDGNCIVIIRVED